MTVAHEHNADRTRENGWAYWRCTGCGELCHYASQLSTPTGIAYCSCCTESGGLPCLACGDPCLATEIAEHIRTKHPACPVCLVIEGSALGTGCTCEDPTEAEFEAMMAEGTPVELVDKPGE